MLTFVRSELDWGYSRNALTPDTLARAGGSRLQDSGTQDFWSRERENLGYDSYHPALPGHVRSHWPEPSSRRVAPPLAHCGEFPGVSWFLAGTPTQCYNLSFAQYLHNSNWFPLCIWHMVFKQTTENNQFIAVQCRSSDHVIELNKTDILTRRHSFCHSTINILNLLLIC